MKALLVDYGGVLTSPVTESFAAFCAVETIDVELFRRAVLGAAREKDSPFARVETGAITQEIFDFEVASLLSAACGRTIAPLGLKQRMFATVRPDEAMVGAVLAARAAGVRTALLSNSWGGNDYPRDRFDELFDAVVISGEVGMRKPNPDIFLHTADLVGIAPAECAFVDDFAVNITGANAVGMTGVLHRSAVETLGRLADIFQMPFPV